METKQEQIKIISPIAIDMGAKNTGVYLNHFTQGEDPTTSGNIMGKTIVIDSSSITWSQVKRTQKRHQIRSKERRKLAKRLLRLILTDKQILNLTIEPKQLEFLMGLLNRRGYTYLVEDLDENLVNQSFVAEYFVENHAGFFKSKDGFYNDFLAISNDIEKGKSLEKVLTLSKLDAKKSVEENKQEFADAYDNIKTALKTQINAEDGGHKYRTLYLRNIKADIEKSSLLKPLLNNNLTAENLAFLIGNISNLQLRILRKYFNSKAMKSGDLWEPKKLHELFFKWIRSWHAKQDNEKRNRVRLLALKSNKCILDVLTTSNPKSSIPPYEDQNNRRPPKDLTLRLKPTGLDKCLQDWQTITNLLVDSYILPQVDKCVWEKICITEGLKDNVRIQKGSNETDERQISADTLHRILDRSTVLDPYKFRWLAQGSNTPEARNAKNLLNRHSKNQADNIIALAKEYYAEVDIAKQGLWTATNSLFFRCETNPPHKSNIQHRLVGHILRDDFLLDQKTKKSKKLEEFKEKCWNKKINGKSTTKSIAGKVEETRKEYGNKFNYIVKTIQRRRYILAKKETTKEQKDRWEKEEHDYQDVVDAIKNAALVATEINTFLNHNKKAKEKYNNPYSIAQLYNHLESEISGFSKTDKWNTEENAWRNKEQTIEVLNKTNEVDTVTVSNASRLTADSIRPFDGMLDRIISRQAHEIANMKIEQIEGLGIDKNDTLFVPIFMEQNRFLFEQSLHEIKGLNNIKKKTKDRVEKGEKNQKTQWKDKDSRIKKNKYCPYTGQEITKGEIDHIIPQSESKKRGDVVFNSEANLIYCSSNGNHAKGDSRYSFDQLKPAYLKEIFGHSNAEQIQQEIRDFINRLDDNNLISFHNLETKEQNYLRHALFIRELDGKTFPLLNTRYKTLVNGTQGYLGKQIRKLLQEKYPNVEVKTYQINAQEVSQLRAVLGENDENLKKQDRQGVFSHVVDAALVLAAALKSEVIAKALTTTHLVEESEKGEWLKNLLPENSEVQHIKRKPKYRKNLSSTQIFKEGLYGERFMSILLDNEKLYYGFSLDNHIEIKLLKEPKIGIKNFDKKLREYKEKQLTEQNEYFNLLKSFLHTGSSRKRNKKSVTGSLLDNQQKYTYLSIDKAKALAHLQKCAKDVCDDKEIKQAEALGKLHYSVEKKEIKSTLLTGQGKKTFIKQLEYKKLKVSGLWLPAKSQWEQLIGHSIKNYYGNKTTLKECFGKAEKLEVDNKEMVCFWQDLSRESELEINFLKDSLLKQKDKKGNNLTKPYFISKTDFKILCKNDDRFKSLNDCKVFEKFGDSFQDTKDLIPQESWDKLFKEFFLLYKPKNTAEYIEKENRKKENRGSHHQVRKVFSLPIVSNPSGGFRIKRKNPLTGEAVYQVSGVEGFATKGYDETLKTPVLIEKLAGSVNIASLDGKQEQVEHVCYFDEWRIIEFPEELAEKITSLSYSVGSKDRFNIRVSMSFDEFKNLDETIHHFSDIPDEMKEPKQNDSWKFKKTDFQQYFSSKLLGKPRSNLFVEEVGTEQIIFSYIVENTNKEMKTAYQNGTPIK